MDSPLKWHGGKSYLAKKIIELMPPRCANPNKPDLNDNGWLHYVEPFAGGLSVLLENDPTGISEVVNDLNSKLTNFWRVLGNESRFDAFCRAVQTVPFSEQEYRDAESAVLTDNEGGRQEINESVAFFIRCRQSMSGRMKDFAPLTRNRTRRGMNEQASAWLNCAEGLPAVHERLKRVVILNRDVLDVIRQQDGPRTLFYLDPPYLHETRATTGEYEHEMTTEQHHDLCVALSRIKGRFLLSGYKSDLYESMSKAHGWNVHEFELPNNAAGGKTKRRMTECVWTNYR